MMSKFDKKKYLQTFKSDYSKQFCFIKKSNKGVHHAFCEECSTDISISHGGKNDIVQHIGTKKHIDKAEANAKSSKINISQFFSSKDEITRAECLFTAFFIEHNLPLSCADHVGPLLRKIFTKNEIAQKYSCARTKTSAIVSEWATSNQKDLITTLQSHPFSLATDGSNSDSKMYPIVVTFFNSDIGQIKNNLLAVPILKDDSTGLNICNLILNKLEELNVPLLNCVAFSSDNAPVMIGNKAGVLTILRSHHKNLLNIGCPCHLLNIAAEKGASCFPLNVDDFLVDLFYYFKGSTKRKKQLEKFQELHNDEIKKVLKHVQTRWLSTTKCLERVLYLWDALIAFFKEEIDRKNNKNVSKNNLDFFTIPKKSGSKSEIQKQSFDKKCATAKRKNDIFDQSSQEPPKKVQKLGNLEKNMSILTREERLYYLLTSDANKAYCLFLLYVAPTFEKLNVILQGQAPLIHKLLSLLHDLLKQIMLKFVKATVLKENANLLVINYHNEENQKSDEDLLIGEKTTEVVKTMKLSERKIFFSNIRRYYVRCCDYMILKFPFKDDTLCHAEVCNIDKIDSASFTSLKFFIDKFPIFVKEDQSAEIDQIKLEFCNLQATSIPNHILQEERVDIQWNLISKMKNPLGEQPFYKIASIMLGILCIPHSNAECERMFSIVRKNRTEFRSSLSDESLEDLLILKSNFLGKCYEQHFDTKFLNRAKSATSLQLKS